MYSTIIIVIQMVIFYENEWKLDRKQKWRKEKVA